MATVLAEHANEPVDIGRVVRMLLVHDIVEVDAGDTFAYDTAGAESKAERERRAAARMFGLLPGDQGDELRVVVGGVRGRRHGGRPVRRGARPVDAGAAQRPYSRTFLA